MSARASRRTKLRLALRQRLYEPHANSSGWKKPGSQNRRKSISVSTKPHPRVR